MNTHCKKERIVEVAKEDEEAGTDKSSSSNNSRRMCESILKLAMFVRSFVRSAG